jgi:hypothetical protein
MMSLLKKQDPRQIEAVRVKTAYDKASQEKQIEREEWTRRENAKLVSRKYGDASPAKQQEELIKLEELRRNVAAQQYGVDPLTGQKQDK